MSVTIKKIAQLSGVSRGTVDRVLNHRGRVKPETEELVRRVAVQLGYAPNRAGKALAARKKSFVIGIVTPSVGIPFFDDVLRGVAQAEKELIDYGVTLEYRASRGYDPSHQLEFMEELESQVNALVLTPILDPLITGKINALIEKGIPVITMNTDAADSKRLCYVGSDYELGGKTACGMLGLLTNGTAKLGVLSGSIKNAGHIQRIRGFREIKKEKFPAMEVVDFQETADDDIVAYENTRHMLKHHPEIDALFIAAAGGYGACRAVLSLGRERGITIVSFDAVPDTVEMMRRGVIQATICQQPVQQGYQAVKLAFDCLVTGLPPQKDNYLVDTEIKIIENMVW